VDFKKHVSQALQLAPGGYISLLDPAKGWTQITGAGTGGPEAPVGSRRQRRGLGRIEWRRSER
jgi:hypothetical protein